MSLESYKYTRGDLTILDQLLLPREQVYISVRGVDDGWAVINKMQVLYIIYYIKCYILS